MARNFLCIQKATSYDAFVDCVSVGFKFLLDVFVYDTDLPEDWVRGKLGEKFNKKRAG